MRPAIVPAAQTLTAAAIHGGNAFVLNVRNGLRLVTFTGRVTPDGRFMSGTVVGFSPNPRQFMLHRTR